MRKIILFSVFTFVMLGFASAQKVRLGLTASPTITWMKPDKFYSSGKVRAGFEYGLLTDIAMNDDGNYNISTGILLSINGGNATLPLTNIKFQVQYVSLPLLLKLKTHRFGSDKFAAYGQFGT